jgi:site-specific DNA-cytosine methylase
MSVTDELVGMTEIALFAGGGGGVLGSKMLGIRTVAYVEWDAYPQAVLKARMADGLIETAPVFGDVREFDTAPYAGNVDVVSGGFPCFVAGTMVLSRDGYRAIETLSPGDEVLTHLGRWRPVTSVMVKHDAPLREIHAQGVPGVVCTDEHPFYARTTRVGGEGVWTDAAEITPKHRLAQVLPSVEDDEHTPEFWWLVGRYLADGWRVARHNRPDGNGRVVICAGFHEADDLARAIEAAGFHATRSDERTVAKFHIVNNVLYRFLEPFGHLAHGKRIPAVALSLSPEKARALLEGYLTGDGGTYQNAVGAGTYRRATTVSRGLALGIALLAQRAYGVVATVRFNDLPAKTTIEGRTVNQRGWYAVTIPGRNRSATVEGDYGWKKVKSNTPAGKGVVFNIAVQEDESYVADGAVVHNCQPFSTAGRQEADFDPRNMWPATRDIIRGVRPKYAYLENVAGLLTGTHGYFGVVIGELARSGYDVAWTCLPAAAVGAPHRRDRMWILGRRRDVESTGTVPLAEFARFDEESLSWRSGPGRCRGDTASTVTASVPWPRSGFVRTGTDGSVVVYALDPVSQADGTTRDGWPWPRILEDLRIPDPLAGARPAAPDAPGVEMLPTPNAFDAHAVGASRAARRPEWGRHGVSLHHLAADWSAHEGRTYPTPLAGNATPGEGGNHGGMALRAAAVEAEFDHTRTWATPTVQGLNGGSGAVAQISNLISDGGVDPVEIAIMFGRDPGNWTAAGAAIEEAGGIDDFLQALDGSNAREWPTPMASNNRKSRRALLSKSLIDGGQGSPPGLEQAVELASGIIPKELEGVDPDTLPPATRAMWPIPQASAVSNDVNVRKAAQRSPDSPPNKLGWAVGEAEDVGGGDVGAWPTPRAKGLAGGSSIHDFRDNLVADGVGDEAEISAMFSLSPRTGVSREQTPQVELDLDDLEDLASGRVQWHLVSPSVKMTPGYFPTPTACDAFGNNVDGWSPLGRFIQNNNVRPPRRSKEEREAARANRGPVGQLNPDWVEWLMGWPVGWTSMSPMTDAEAQAYAADMPGPWWRREPPHVPRITVGTPDRAARLKACGNGQVPLCNAAAFEVLLETYRQIGVACAHVPDEELDAFDLLGL